MLTEDDIKNDDFRKNYLCETNHHTQNYKRKGTQILTQTLQTAVVFPYQLKTLEKSLLNN